MMEGSILNPNRAISTDEIEAKREEGVVLYEKCYAGSQLGGHHKQFQTVHAIIF